MANSVGLELREARIGRRWTLRDVADRAGVGLATVHAAESGRPVSLESYARLALALGQRPRISLEARSTRVTTGGGVAMRDLVHAAMGEVEARQLAGHGNSIALDEPYQHFQFAGRADVLAWNLEAGALLHIENKSRLHDLQDLAGSYNAKRAYLAPILAERLGLRDRWRTVTHALVVLWSSEVLRVVRQHRATFAALCPSPLDPFATWWNGAPRQPGVTSSLVVLDPDPSLSLRRPRFVGADRVASVDPRYRDYAAAAATLRVRGGASRRSP